MGFFSSDMEAMIEIYQSETMELIGSMEEHLLTSEESQHLDEEAVNGLFRIVHTIKSSSAMMGMDAMSICSHRLEDLFFMFREGTGTMDGHEEEVYNVLYTYIDYVKNEMQRLQSEDFEPTSADSLIEAVKELLSVCKPILEKETENHKTVKSQAAVTQKQDLKHVEMMHQNQTEGENTETADKAGFGNDDDLGATAVYNWKVVLAADCQMENVRAYMLCKQLTAFCEQVASEPANLQGADAAADIRKNGLVLHLMTRQIEVVINKLSASPYVDHLEDMDADEDAIEEDGANKEKADDSHTADSNDKEVIAEEKQALSSSISWQRILRLQQLTGELITYHNQILGMLKKQQEQTALEDLALASRRVLSELETVVNAAALMPVASMAQQYYRIVRDIAHKQGKKIHFEVRGKELEVDKTIIDAVTAPLMHLIRNAVDHGIEPPDERVHLGKAVAGHICFEVVSQGDHVLFIVSDDGRGLNRDNILQKAQYKGMLTKEPDAYSDQEVWEFIFMPGFSTSEQVTEFSGRGVGMDVVRKMVDRMGGNVFVDSKSGSGSKVTVQMPVSLTSMDGIQFLAGGSTFLVPTKNVEHIYAYQDIKEQLVKVGQSEYLQVESMMPVLRMYEILHEEKESEPYILTMNSMKGPLAIVTGPIIGQMNIVEKALPEMIGPVYRQQTGITGCMIDADGEIGFILSAERLYLLLEGE